MPTAPAPRRAPVAAARVLVVVALAALAVACSSDGDRRTFGASCDSPEVCGCFVSGEGDDPSCERDGTDLTCVEQRCSLACTFGDDGDAYCRARFRPTTACRFEGYCAE